MGVVEFAAELGEWADVRPRLVQRADSRMTHVEARRRRWSQVALWRKYVS